MNLPNKLTVTRIILSLIIIFILLFPFSSVGIEFPNDLEVLGATIKIKYLIAGILFIIASITDFLDGYIARKRGLITNTGKMLDAIADKVLVNSVLIILASQIPDNVNPIIPVVIVIRDIIVNAIKMEAAGKGKVVAAIKSGKWKTATLMVGIVLEFFGNFPFETLGIRVADFFLYLAMILSIVSMIQYYKINKKLIIDEK